MKEQAKNIIDIIPLTRIPLSRGQSFSYLHSEKLTPGTLVSIPLFRRKVQGIVTGNRPDFERLGNIELKKIDEVVEENFLDKKQMELAEFISEYYFSPLGIVLKSFVPKRTKERKKLQNTNPKPQVAEQSSLRGKQNTKNIKLTKEQQTAVDKITKIYSKFKIQNSKFLLYGPASSGKTEIYIHSILKLATHNSQLQFLILLPELTLTPQAIERYGEYFKPEETVVLHSKISKGQFYSSWQKIKSGEAKIIIGSRMAVFAPFKNLGLIVIDEEQDMSFKQWDMNPRYDARTVAEKLAELHKCKIVFGSATPRVEDYYKAQQEQYTLVALPILKLQTITAKAGSRQRGTSYKLQATQIELVDMKKERWIRPPAGGYSPISKKLQSEIAYALKNKLQIILFINRQGMSNFSICAQCKTVLRCPKCNRALIYDREGIYKCVHCSYKTSITPACSKCKSLAFTNIGLGTQKIEKEIANLFPQARIARADNQTMKAPNAQEILYGNFKNGNTDILIGTQMISKGWDLPNVALIGIIDGDGMLSIPDFSTEEKAFQSIIQAAGRASRLGAKFPGVVLVQTFKPEQDFFKIIAQKDYQKFYLKEIKERKDLKLPPFGKLIKLIYQDYSAKKASAEAEKIYQLLSEKKIKGISPVKYANGDSASQKFNGVNISEPQDAFVPNVRGRYRKQILIKFENILPKEINSILYSLPSGWIIDIDPISIL